MKRSSIAAIIAALGMAALTAHAAVTAAEAEKLGKELTPVGAEKAGNKEGTIPAWSGKEDIPSGWSYGKSRRQFSKLKDDKPLFSIDASNVDKYADKLTPGQVALVKMTKGYRMDVYQTHRNCGVNPAVAERTKQNALEAKLDTNNWGLAHAKAAGVPFPIPKTGAEAMWNHKLRSMGTGYVLNKGMSLISPRRGTNDWVPIKWELTAFYPAGRKEVANVEDNGAVEFYKYYKFFSPTAMAGQALVSVSYLNKETDVYYYFPGQRRVRRMPTYAYDTPQIGFENQYTADQDAMFWSALDRFDYKLVGKKEIYIPNNAFRMYEFADKQDNAYNPDFINPEYRRYELHRVWVVEATVKQGVRHTFPKRVFYLDEDTWNNVVAEDYDANGRVWKAREAYQIPVWELGGTCSYAPFTQYDLQEGRYVADYQVFGQGEDVRFYSDVSEPRFKPTFYTPDNLRAISER